MTIFPLDSYHILIYNVNMITNNEITKMMAEIFKKEEIPVCELPASFSKLVEIAKGFGLSYLPQIIISHFSEISLGRLDFNTYSEPVIIISPLDYNGQTRTEQKMVRTLAHELGHCFQVQDGTLQHLNFKEQEDGADEWRNILLAASQ
jgi:hypothetical protein